MKNKTISHIPILDGIRGVAILMVCFVHFFSVNESSLYETNKYIGVLLFKISFLGLKGVELFFILSGFLITNILYNSKNSKRYFLSFYSRRFLRIFPLYYFVLGVSFFILPSLISINANGRNIIENQGWLWTYTSNLTNIFYPIDWGNGGNLPSFGHFWSLCVEEHFYLFWPFLIYFSTEKRLPRIMWSIVFLSVFSSFFVFIFDDLVPIFHWSTIKYSGVLSLGGLISYYRSTSINYERVIQIAKKLVLPSFILFIVVNFLPRESKFYEVSTFFTSIIFFAFLLIISLENEKISSTIFKHRFLYFIGKISYGIYVYHEMLVPYFTKYVYNYLEKYIQNGILCIMIYTLICTAISVFIAWCSWHLIEKPILKFKLYFNYEQGIPLASKSIETVVLK